MKTIALITDFGSGDYFVGVLKGVIKKINPEVEILDISNDIASYNILSAAFIVEKSFRYFPGGTIFLVVVDPGVGSERKILLIKYNNYYFIAPDNGVLTPILDKKDKIVRIIENKKYFLINGYSTFEARDKMAPVAAYISAGIDIKEMTTKTSEYVLNSDYFPKKSIDSIEGRIVYIDKFGNIITNIAKDLLLNTLKKSGFSKFILEINRREIKIYQKSYSDGSEEPFMLIGSHGNLEIAMNKNSAASNINANLNQKFIIKFYL